MARKLWRAQPWFGALLLIAMLALGACGSSEPPTAPAIPPTPTLIPTLSAPATAVPAAAVATAEPAATATPATDAEAAVESGEATEATEEITASEEVTATETITAEIVPSDAVTATDEVTMTDEVTATDGITATATITEDVEVTSTAEITATDEVTSTDEVTTTEALTDTEDAHTEDAHAGHATHEAEAAASSAMTSTASISTTSDARVYFLQPTTNAIVPVTFTVVMSYTGFTLAPTAGHAAGTGHLHLLIDTDFIEAGQPMPSDDQHLHILDGASEVELTMVPGSHTLRLQLADNNHIALVGDQYRAEIIVVVEEGAPEQAIRIVTPTEGATVPNAFIIQLAATGLNVGPVGTDGSGHFHILVDEPFVSPGRKVVIDRGFLHESDSLTSTSLNLDNGTHLIRVQYVDHNDIALGGNQYRAEIQVIAAPTTPLDQVMFTKPADGATVTSPFLVSWAASGLIIEPAGAVSRPEGGHLHILIDEDFIPAGEPIPNDETHLHFGKAQTSAELALEPGEYTLRLQMADGAHIAQDGPQYRDEITVTVR